MRPRFLADVFYDGITDRINPLLQQHFKQTRRILGLDQVGLGNQRIRLGEAVFDDRRQRIEVGLANVNGAEQIDDAC